jgi:hypothetical protein
VLPGIRLGLKNPENAVVGGLAHPLASGLAPLGLAAGGAFLTGWGIA